MAGTDFEPYTSPDYDFERSLQWLYGDRCYLQGSKQDFIDLFSREKDENENIMKTSDPADLIKFAKLALAKSELKIAEKLLVKAMRTGMLDNFSTKSPEPYFYLAEILERKAENKEFELVKRQRYLLQAAALYCFVRNYLKSRDIDVELSIKLSDLVTNKLRDIQNNMITLCGGNSDTKSRFDEELRKSELTNFRNEVKKSLESIKRQSSSSNQGRLNECEARQEFKDQTEKVKKLSGTVSERMKQFLASIIDECLALLGTPSCDYEVIVFGSLARNETTPYSDFEWAILTNSEEEECKVFFRNLTNLVHLQVINLGETILPSMNIEAINGEWFYDDVTPRGVSFDGLLPQACKIPLGNMQDFELIHTPEKMAEFQSNEWYSKNWSLADTLMTFAPLRSEKSVLAKAYRKEMDKILFNPCDSESCQHDPSSDTWPTRGSCRGLRILKEDLFRYGDIITGNSDLDEGKFYDVKKEIYRLTDRVFAALAKCYGIEATETFVVLDELYEKEVISLEARDDFACASAIAIKLRLSTYLIAGKQGEHLGLKSNEETGKLASVYHLPTDEELFYFFFVAIPLYDELRQFKTTNGIPSSLANHSFFDNSDITMGHIYCRLLNYDKAIECYERAVQENPENLSVEIRRVRVALFASHNREGSSKIQENLDILLGKIVKNFSLLDTNVNEKTLEFEPCLNSVEIEECRQLVEGLLFASSIYKCRKYFVVARKILFQCLSSNRNKPKELLILKFAFLNHSSEIRVQQQEIDAVVSQLTSFIEEEGVSTKSIVWLNRLGEFLFRQGKRDRAYRCFQRALSMEHVLSGTRPNPKMMTTLRFLAMIASGLFMYAESKFYYEYLVQLFESFGGINVKLLMKETYLKLAFLTFELGYAADETLHHVENGLNVITGSNNDHELFLNCLLYCKLATTLYFQQSPEQASKAVLDAQACRRDCACMHTRALMTCLVAQTFCEIKKSKEGIELLKEELQKFPLKSQVQEEVICLKALGKLCLAQGQALEAKKYYSQAIDILVEKAGHVFDALQCLIAISKALVLEGKGSKAKKFLEQAFSSAKKIPASDKKCSFLQEIGETCESISEISLARLCYDAAVDTCKEESNISKKLPFMEINLEMKLGELLDSSRFGISLQQRLQAQRTHYDRAAVILRQHVAIGQVDSTTVTLFLALALKYTSVDPNEKVKLLFETLKVSEIVYGTDKSHQMVAKIVGQLSDTYLMSGDKQASIKYRELQIRMELELHSENPFHEDIISTLTLWASTSFEIPSDNDSIERVCEIFLSSLMDEAFLSTTRAVKISAAKCFTLLSVLFYTSSDFEKARSLNEKGSQIFNDVQEGVEIERDPYQKSCDLMKTILSSGMMLPSHRTDLYNSFREIFISYFESLTSKKEWLTIKNRHARDQEINKEVKEQVLTLKSSSDGGENLKPFVPSLKPDKTTSLDTKNMERLKQTLSKISYPPKLESIPDELKEPGMLEITTKYFDQSADELFSVLPTIHSQLDALTCCQGKGDFQGAAQIHASLQPLLLDVYENSPFDAEENLISEAIKAKDRNHTSNAIRYLDLALQLPEAQCRRTPKILKIRAQCFLSMADFRSAAIDFTKADALYSIETIDNHEDLSECSEVLIGLIKSEILCNNVGAAWLVCEKGINLASDHELKEAISKQAVKLFYLGAKCVHILSERGEDKEDKLVQTRSLCQQALFLSEHIHPKGDGNNLMEEVDGGFEHGEIFATKCEVQLLLADVFLKLGQKNEAEKLLQEMKTCLTIINNRISADSMGKAKPEFVKMSRRIWSWLARVLVMLDDIEQSLIWVDKSLVAFFSNALPDFLSLYEEFLPLLQAITAIKSRAPDQSRSPFQQVVDMCKEISIKQDNSLNNVYQFLKTLIAVYRSLRQVQEATVVADTGLEITDFMCDNNDGNQINNRCRMLLYLAQLHQQNASNSAIDEDKEFGLAENYYLRDRCRKEDMVLRKDLSYANFLCERKRFAEAFDVLQGMSNLGELLCTKCVYFDFFSCVFYGAGVEKSVKIDGELFTTIKEVLYNVMVRANVGMGKKKEAVATCETLTGVNLLDVHEQLFGKRPSCKPFLVEDCHRELLSLLSEEERHQFQTCDLPLSSANLAKLYYMLGEYEVALKYFPKDVESSEMLEMKISCLRLAGNELVVSNRGNESLIFFMQFLAILQDKEGFLDKPFNNQCEILQTYSCANVYYLFRSLGKMQAERENIDVAIQCYERCIELDEDFTYDQDIVATLSELYQTKALTDDVENKDLWTVYMDLALKLFEKLFQKTTEKTTFVELTFASLLSRLGRYEEAVKHFDQVVIRANDTSYISFGNVDKPLVDVFVRREIEAHGGNVSIPINILALYELISIYTKMDKVGKAEEVAFLLESIVKKYNSTSANLLSHSLAGYAYKIIGNKEKAAEIFVSALEMNPGHPPVTEALESCCT